MIEQRQIQQQTLPVEAVQLSPQDLRKAFGKFATGVCVVTANGTTGPVGITINSFSSISLEPALVSWAIASKSSRYQYFLRCETMSIHVLADSQLDICHAFARTAHAFGDLDWRKNIFGSPVFDHAIARFDVRLVQNVKAGDHNIFIAEVLNTVVNQGRPLVFLEGALTKA